MSKNQEQQPTHAEVIWGSQILDDGFTVLPNIITRNYRNLGMTHGEFAFITLLVTFKHDTKDPFPSQTTLAKLYFGNDYTEENSERAIRKIIASLKKKELLRTGRRRNMTSGQYGNSVYGLQPLVTACLKLQGEKEVKLPDEYGVEWDDEPQEQKVPMVPEQKVPEPPEQKVPVVPEQKVPSKKKREKDSFKKKNEKESIYQEQIKNLEIGRLSKKVLKDSIDRLILFNIKLLEVELLFSNSDLSDRNFASVLSDVLQSEIKKSFKRKMEVSIDTFIENANKKPSLQRKGRTEIVPESLNVVEEPEEKKALSYLEGVFKDESPEVSFEKWIIEKAQQLNSGRDYIDLSEKLMDVERQAILKKLKDMRQSG